MLRSGLAAGVVLCVGCTIVPADDDGTSTKSADPYCDGVSAQGECLDAHTVRRCFTSEAYDTEPELVVVPCDSGEVCRVEDGIASCVPEGQCYPGETRCDDDQTLARCVDGSWVEFTCGIDRCVAQPSIGAECLSLSQAGGTGIFLRGHIDYEYLEKKSDLSGFESTPSTQPATDMLITVYDGQDLIGIGLTSFGDGNLQAGDWEIELDKNPTDQTYFYFWPLLFDENGQPLLAVANAGTSGSLKQHSEAYWWWGFGPVCDSPGECTTTDTGQQLIGIDEGSGAAHVYRWLAYGLFRMNEVFGIQTPHSFVALWSPGQEGGCGTCLLPPGYAPSVTYGEGPEDKDKYDAAVVLAGTSDTPTHWSVSIIGHEYGHLVHHSYSEFPGEAGPHSVSSASPPGMAFSEGFATYLGQTNMSASPSDNEPIYFAKQQGTNWWMDVGKAQYFSSDAPAPNPQGPLDQDLSELVVAAMMWSFWASSNADAPQGLGDPTLEAMNSPRLTGGMNRGYSTIDFVDYLDALKCDGIATSGQIDDVRGAFSFYYDHAQTCP